MLKMLNGFFLVGGLTFSSISFAATPTDDSIEKLMNAIKAEKIIDASFSQYDQYIKDMMMKFSTGPELTPLQEKRLDAIGAQMKSFFEANFGGEVAKRDFSEIFCSEFTQEEVDAQIQFFSTPLGQSITEKTLSIQLKISDRMMKRMLDATPQLMAALAEANERFDEENREAIEAEYAQSSDDAAIDVAEAAQAAVEAADAVVAVESAQAHRTKNTKPIKRTKSPKKSSPHR